MEYYARLKPSWIVLVAVAAKWLQSWPTLCDPRDGSPPGSPVPGILQARTLEWVAISFSNLLLPYPYFIFPLKVSEGFFPPENFPLKLYMFFYQSQNAVAQNFKRIWMWTFFHSWHLNPHRPVEFWNLLSCFNLGIFSSFFFDDFFFPISLFLFSHSHLY